MIHALFLFTAVAGCSLALFSFVLGVEDLDHPSDLGGAVNLTSFRSISLGLGVFGLTGLFLDSLGVPSILALVPALIFGLVAIFLLARTMRIVGRLEEDLSFRTYEALGESGFVYIPIEGEHAGKVMVTVRGYAVEFPAVATKFLPTGTEIVVTGYRDEGVLEVSRKD